MKDPEHYEQLKIKEYTLWNLFLHEHQYPYVGRCYAWAKRKDASRVTEMFSSERDELFSKVLVEWETAIRKLFGQFWPNLTILGNETPHLHAHLIPRYDRDIKVYGVTFPETNHGKNYAPYPRLDIELPILHQITDDIKAKL